MTFLGNLEEASGRSTCGFIIRLFLYKLTALEESRLDTKVAKIEECSRTPFTRLPSRLTFCITKVQLRLGSDPGALLLAQLQPLFVFPQFFH